MIEVWFDDSAPPETSLGYCIREIMEHTTEHDHVVAVSDREAADIIHMNSIPWQRSHRFALATDTPVFCTQHGAYIWWEHEIRLLRRPLFLVKKAIYWTSQRFVDRISFSTEYARSLAVRNGGIDESLTTVIPLGYNELYTDKSQTDTEKFVLCPINVNNRRKNIQTLIRTIERMPDTLFILCGAAWTDVDTPENADVRGWVDEEELIDLYNRAAAVYLPTLFEGFGLPFIEAMACGTVVVTNRIPTALEVCGEAAIYTDDRRSAQNHARKIKHVLEDDDLRKHHEKAGLERAERYSWEQTAKRYVQCYEGLT